MRPSVESFLQRGYFPKELPPPFNTFSFGTKYSNINSKWQRVSNPNRLRRMQGENEDDFGNRKKAFKRMIKEHYSSSTCVKFSISKGKLSRRYIGIPNPLQYMCLAQKVTDAWDELLNIINSSKYSQSKPVFQTEFNKRTLTPSSKGVAQFTKYMLDKSFNKKVELRLDLSKFYTTIYTHSIPWALLGKKEAKEIYSKKNEINRLARSGDANAILYQKADAIDTAARNCQGQQTIGIPIGPDISYVIAELITSRIDIVLSHSKPDITGCRYYDDYYLYTNTVEEAEEIFKFLQSLFSEFGLEINDSKVSIRKFPFEFVEKFSSHLSQFNFSNRFEQSLKLYFNIIWKCAEDAPEKTNQIFKYALKIFEPTVIDRLPIPPLVWGVFENLLLKTVILDPTILDAACQILELYIDKVSKDKLQKVVDFIFREHIPVNQHLEVSWALWLCKKFDLVIQPAIGIAILKMRDAISCLILLDIKHNYPHLINPTSDLITEISLLDASFDKDSLTNGDWLLLYEGVKQGWISRTDLIDDNLFFSILSNNDIEFYDLSPDVNFKSNEYVFSRPELVITQDMKDRAKTEAERIYAEILNQKAVEIKEEEEEEMDDFDIFMENSPKTIDEIKEELEENLTEMGTFDEIYNSILTDLIRDNNTDVNELIAEYLSKLEYYRSYCE